jgi:hypothetical protein
MAYDACPMHPYVPRQEFIAVPWVRSATDGAPPNDMIDELTSLGATVAPLSAASAGGDRLYIQLAIMMAQVVAQTL